MVGRHVGEGRRGSALNIAVMLHAASRVRASGLTGPATVPSTRQSTSVLSAAGWAVRATTVPNGYWKVGGRAADPPGSRVTPPVPVPPVLNVEMTSGRGLGRAMGWPLATNWLVVTGSATA